MGILPAWDAIVLSGVEGKEGGIATDVKERKLLACAYHRSEDCEMNSLAKECAEALRVSESRHVQST